MENSNSNDNNKDFMREKIKQRPINRKKLLRRTIITVTMAVVFGAVACLTFVFLSPVINNKLYPEEIKPVTLTKETVTDEMQPEDMYADDNAIAAEAASAAIDMASSEIDRMQREINSMTSKSFDPSDYADLYSSLKVVAITASKSIVKVTAVTSDTNWFNDPYQSEGSVSGVIVAENGIEYLILVESQALEGAESIQVTFQDGASSKAYLKMSDSVTGYSIIAVKEKGLDESTKSQVAVAALGSSGSSAVTGTPVIAIGSPTGTHGSISYGFVTSANAPIDLPDSDYRLITTDIYGATNASGVILNLSGWVIGFVDMNHNADTLPNVLCGVGITELKSLIEDLSNGTGRSYLGLHGQTVPQEVSDGQSVPPGAYITRTEIDSPAMLAGIQSGDIITKVNDLEVDSYETLVSELLKLHPGANVVFTLMRQATDGYVELTVEMTIASSSSNEE